MLALYLKLRNLFVNEAGQDLIEYALLVALLVLAAIFGLGALGDEIAGLWGNIQDEIGGAVGS